MKRMDKNIGLAVATMMVMMLLIATVVESASPTEKITMIELVTNHHAASSFPRKMMRNGKGNGVCPIIGRPCNPEYGGCGPFSDTCACYTAGHCGDFVG
ncbi:hypothetical protein Csa_014579 [Cucumis sativus]|uniref:Uncharacterized protein n=1 Tax=Cucumis sativus TaxID=3659 RepID=A0A0A0KWE4_CUCSA|nr:hypothetical protein Csa_014579 [Cucumis sativus]